MINVSVIGIGKLGLCFSLSLENVGINVLGVDLNRGYVESINQKTFTTTEPLVNERLRASKNFIATTDLDRALEHSDLIFVVVATPSLPDGSYDHTQIDALASNLVERGVQRVTKNLIVNCTTMPTYCESLQKKLEGYNWTVTYNPEFIAQGSVIRDQENPDMVLIGEANEEVGDRLQTIYESMTQNNPIFHRMTPTEAEITKLSLNCFLTTKIAYTNMVGDIVRGASGNPQIVLDAIGSDSRVGSKLTRYGFGFGGPCFPRDNRALAIFAKSFGLPADISLATDRLNEKHLNFQIEDFLAEQSSEDPIIFDGAGGCVTSSNIFEGVTYKKGTTIIEESQQLAFAAKIAYHGYDVLIIDCEEVVEQVREIYGDLFKYEVVE